MKRFLATILTICLLLSAVPFTSSNVRAESYNAFVYDVFGGEARITGYNQYYISSFGNVTIPATLGGYPVTTICDRAFYNCDDLTSLVIQSNITYIGDYAFSDCNKLKSVTLPYSVTDMGEYAFSNCDLLENVDIENGLPHISNRAFYGCKSLKSIVLPKEVLSVGAQAFSSCSSLEKAIFEGSDTTIGNAAFAYCSSLYLVSLPSKLTSISEGLFLGSGLSSINLPNSIKNIGERAFSGCPNLDWIDIPLGVETIGDMVFQLCPSLRCVSIPKSVTSIGEGAFISNDSLWGVIVNENNENYSSINGVLFDKEQKKLICYPKGKTETNYTIPSSVTSIHGHAFWNCYSLENINLGNAVTEIGENAFNCCIGLTSIIVPNSLKSVGRQAFFSCNSLADIWYTGSKEDKSSIAINAYNSPLNSAIWHFNICDEHSYSNNCDNSCNNCEWIRIVNEHVFDSECDSECNECGEKREAPHIYDNNCDSICNKCNTIREVKPHNYDNSCDTNCNECGEIREIVHTYDNACDSICNICFDERIVEPHIYDNDCDTACNICNLVRTVGPHTYKNICDTKCDVCEYERMVSHVKGSILIENQSNCYLLTNSDSCTVRGLPIYLRISALRDCSIKVTYTLNRMGQKLYMSSNNGFIVNDSSGTHTYNINLSSGDYLSVAAWYSYDGYSESITMEIIADMALPIDSTSFSCEDNLVCDMCGVVVRDATAHIFDNDCDSTCNICGFERIVEHLYTNNCDIDCNKCGEIRNVQHIYDNACDSICNVCGNTRNCDAHKVNIERYSFSNASNFRFEYILGTYYSTNRASYCTATTTLTVLWSGPITIDYDMYDAYKNYEDIIIKHNDDEVVMYSGSSGWNSITLQARKGDIITISHRTWSCSSGSEYGIRFKLSPRYETLLAENLEPTCEDSVVCSVCGMMVKDALGHVFDNDCDAKCNSCDYTRIVSEHIYDNACDTTCNLCNDTRTVSHSYIDATCTEPKKCIVCGNSDGVALGHDYSEEFIIDKEATAFENGSKSRHCSRCDSVTDVTIIPKTSIVIGTCGDNTMWAIRENGTLIIDGTGATDNYGSLGALPWYSYSDMITAIEIGSDITYIGHYNFRSLTGLTSVKCANPDLTFSKYYVFGTSDMVFYGKGGGALEEYTNTNGYTLIKPENPNTAIAPVLLYKNAYSVTLAAVDGYEYSLDGEKWQKSNIFENLLPDTEYVFYQRIADNVYTASVKSESLEVSTTIIPAAPRIESISGNTVRMVAVSGYEYSVDGVNWQSNNTFTNLEENKIYSAFVRTIPNDIIINPTPSTPTKFIIVSAPKIKLIGATKLFLEYIEGYEYSIDGVVWQSSNIFTDLIPEFDYVVYQRYAGTDLYSSESEGTEFITNGQDEVDINPDSSNLVILRKALMNDVNDMSLDYNADGEINIIDLVRLKKFLVGMDVPLGKTDSTQRQSVELLSQPAYIETKDCILYC